MEYEKRVLDETKKNMKMNREEMNEIMLEKCKKDTYAREVISCSKNASLGKSIHLSYERQLKERLAEIELEIGRTKMTIKKFRQKNWSEKGFKPKDIDAIKEVFITNKVSLEEREDPLAEEHVIKVARFS
jgi:hypothetical protein